MLKNNSVAITRHTKETIVKVPSAGTCPVVEDLINDTRAEASQKRDFYHA